MFIHGSKDIISQIIDRLVMDVVFDFQEAVGFVVGSIDGSVPDVLGVLDQCWTIVQISLSVQVEVSHMIAKFPQKVSTGVIAFGVWRSQISWEIPQNIIESHLIVDDLAVEVRRIQRRQVLMGPGMRSNLVSFCNHSLNDSGPLRSSINRTFSKVVSSDHESGLCIVRQKFVKKI